MLRPSTRPAALGCFAALLLSALGGCTTYSVYDHVGGAWTVRIQTADGYDPDILQLEPGGVAATVGFSGGRYQIDVLDGSLYREHMSQLRNKLENALFAAEMADRSLEVSEIRLALWGLSQAETYGPVLGTCTGRVADFGEVDAHIDAYEPAVLGQLTGGGMTLRCVVRASERTRRASEE